MHRSITLAILFGATPGCNGSTLSTTHADGGGGTVQQANVVQGAACVPSPELSASFGGFAVGEVSIDQNNAACGDGVCLVDHFQGRTTCPDGQTSGGQGASCTVPVSGAPVTANVPPWCADRLASSAVGCSCRCENTEGRTDDGSSYCLCGKGFACTQLVTAIGTDDSLAGGYCIPQGAVFDPASACTTTCAPGVAGCTATDATPGGGTATTSFFTELSLNGGCLPQTLPAASGGGTTCALFYSLAANDTCAAHAGLTAADPTVAASVQTFTGNQAPVCVVAQLVAAGGCSASAQPGWCYTAGTDAGGCAQSIEISPSGEPSSGVEVILGCP